MRAWVSSIGAVFLSVAALGCSKEETPSPEPSLSATSAPAASISSADPNWDKGSGEPVHVAIRVNGEGFEPEVAEFVQGRPAFMDFTRVDEARCGNAVLMPWLKKAVDLPLNETVSIQIPDTSQDGEFRYSCWMNMLFGKVVIRSKTAPSAPDGG